MISRTRNDMNIKNFFIRIKEKAAFAAVPLACFDTILSLAIHRK
jgi:hypothetical protein